MTEENQQIEEHEEPEAIEAPEVTPEREWSDDDEVEARAFGWKPVDEWQGNVPDSFIDDPREFMRRAESFGPFRKLRQKIDQQDEHLRKLESIAAKQVERAQKQAEEEYNRKLAHLDAQKRQAAQEGDLEKYDELTKAQGRIPKPEVETVSPPPENPITAEIKERHKWIDDPYLRRQAAQLVDVGFENGDLPPTTPPAEQVVYAEAKLKAYFPHMFPAEAKPKPSPVEGGGVASTRKSGFGSLPAEAKEAFKRMVQQGVFKDNDEDRKFYYDEYTG